MEFHETPYLGPLVSDEYLKKFQKKRDVPSNPPVPPVGATPEAARQAGDEVSGRVLSVTTNFPQILSAKPEPSIRIPTGLSSLSAMLRYVVGESEWESINIAWPGEIEGLENEDVLSNESKAKFEELLGDQNRPVWLEGKPWKWRHYAERVLWPTLHYSHDIKDMAIEQDVGFVFEGWRSYMELNRKFADVVLKTYKKGDIIVIHDMYLLLLPKLLRDTLPDALIGVYVHSPFPSSELFRSLPQREALLHGMLGATVIGFQSNEYIKHFISATSRLLGIEADSKKLLIDGRFIACAAVPFGINTEYVLHKASSEKTEKLSKEIQALYGQKHIIVGRDKLDNTQGILQKLRAFLELLHLYPEWRGKVVFVQITTKTYQYSPSLEEQMSKLISFINAKYGDIHYTPIIHFTKHMKQREYFALLRNASVGFFMPTREGSSSAALEYVLCQQTRKGSRTSMVMSEFMGISDLLAQGCMLANPFDPIQVAYVLNRALIKSTAKEGSEEQERLFKTAISKYDVRQFVTNILSNLVNHDLKHENQHYTPAADVNEVTSVFKKASKRLLLLDYDGTLTPIVKDPAAAVPSGRLNQVLRRLSEDPNTSVWVISGRDTKFLDQHLSMFKINMSAEHGCYIKRENQSPEDPWENLVDQLDMSWMKVVKDVLQSYTERTEGSRIEEKKSAICWHYRRSDPIFGAFQASHLRAYLELTVSKKFPIDVLNGKAVVEIRPKLFNKGEIVKNIFKEAHDHNDFPEFVMSIGDDTTDEDMFRVLNDEASQKGLFSVIVGPETKLTIAKYHVNSVDKVHDLLESIAKTI